MIGSVAAVTTRTITTEDLLFVSESSVSGNGSFSNNHLVNMEGSHADSKNLNENADMMLKELEHGSGYINNDALIMSQKFKSEIVDSVDLETISAYVWMNAENQMVYSPELIALGSGYYKSHPINCDTLLKERNCVKNYASETSMNHQISQAHCIDKSIEIMAYDLYNDYDGSYCMELAQTSMRFEEYVTDGKAHLGVLQGNTVNDKGTTRKDPVMEVDQNYQGTFHIETDMMLEWPVESLSKSTDWLSCCYGGLETVTPADYYPWNIGIEACQ